MKTLFHILVLLKLTFSVNGQNIFTTAGNGIAGLSGDGGPGTSAKLSSPYGIATDASGNVYFSDNGNNCIRKVNTAGIITTIAGTGVAGFSGDGGSASIAQINSPTGIAIDLAGNVYFADKGNFRIRKINTSGVISTVAGNGTSGYSGDGGSAISAELYGPQSLAIDLSGNLYIGESSPTNMTLRKVNLSGIINTIAGSVPGYSGDGGLATSATFNGVNGLAVDASGNIYITDTGNFRVRVINTSGIISTIAGTGVSGYSGDGGAATAAQLNFPFGIDVDQSGNVYLVDMSNYRIRKINTTGTVTTIAGTGINGYSGDGGLAVQARISDSKDIAVDSNGNLYFTDHGNNRVRVICSNNCVTEVPELKKDIKFYSYPNPGNGSFQLQIDSEIENGEILLINSLGQIVLEQKISQGQNCILDHKLRSGLYNYVILRNKVQIGTGKLIVED